MVEGRPFDEKTMNFEKIMNSVLSRPQTYKKLILRYFVIDSARKYGTVLLESYRT